MEDVRDALAHVLWIGGGPQAGKSTLARLLAGKWDLKIYDLDWRGVHDHERRPTPEIEAFARQTMDERWARPEIGELVERAVLFWEINFALVLEDLRALPRSRVIVAEGPRALPWCVASVIKSPRQAIFLVPTRHQREIAATRRWGDGQVERFPGIVDRETALAKLRERDAILDARIVAACADLGLRCETMDGTRHIDDNLALIEGQFRPHLPEVPNV